ncbi:hypothetical protein [Hymenobacter guriensis]|uniref:Uncharacterized protein n=1 Tax=Hymenobacter guriensis TaxID=2793065 RepID=A0ABS0L4J8_9BACT|nr:hypothetical protein [Hymenobacter guriensis]MBG8555046.1 hypothetical protein [Hymenobacter guriensis]
MMDFLLQHAVEPERIQVALATFYREREALEQEPWTGQQAYHTDPLTGDFALRITVYRSATVEPELAVYLARKLHTKVIISDESLYPFSWLLIDETGEQHAIYEDVGDEEPGHFTVDSRHRYLLTPRK